MRRWGSLNKLFVSKDEYRGIRGRPVEKWPPVATTVQKAPLTVNPKVTL